MSDLTKLARPYAKAAFEFARDRNDLSGWSKMLGFAAQAILEPAVDDLTRNPHVAQAELANMVVQTGGEGFQGEFSNLLNLLAENRRLALLPEIAEQYEHYRREEERRLRVRVVSAKALNEDQSQRMSQALAQRFDREISLHNEVDESLVGGAIIYAGDTVIDGTVRGRLQKLAMNLTD